MPKRVHTSVNFSPYLPPNAEEKLRAYVYRGEDRSLLYKHGWKPLCRALVPHLPYWLAPNLITVAALVFVIFNHIALAQYFPNLKPEEELYGECPSWVFVAAGVGLLIYQLLDNMDGHQARRLGVSSPLGLLMDHGCDAFNCIIGSLSMCAGIGLGNGWKSWWMFLSTVIVFFMNTWEEFYRGELVLPAVNGPNEGIIIGVFLYFISAVKGVTFWTTNFITIPMSILPWFLQQEFVSENLLALARQTHIVRLGYLLSRPPESYVGEFISAIYSAAPAEGTRYPVCFGIVNTVPENHAESSLFPEIQNNGNLEFSLNTLVVWAICLGAVLTSIGNIYQVAVAVRREEEEHRHGRYHKSIMVTKYPFLHALTRLIPLTIVTIISGMWTAASPTRIYEQHPRLYCWTVGMLFTKSAIHLMIAHLCSIEFHPFRRTLVPFFYVLGHMAFSFYRNHAIPHIDEGVTLFEFFMLSAIPFAHLAINVVGEMSDVLGVPVFTVPQEKQRQARELEEAQFFFSSPVHDVRHATVEKELKRLSQVIRSEQSSEPAVVLDAVPAPTILNRHSEKSAEAVPRSPAAPTRATRTPANSDGGRPSLDAEALEGRVGYTEAPPSPQPRMPASPPTRSSSAKPRKSKP